MYLRSACHLLQYFLFTFFLCNVTVSICTRVTEALEGGHGQFANCVHSGLFMLLLLYNKIPFQSLFKETYRSGISSWMFCAYCKIKRAYDNGQIK